VTVAEFTAKITTWLAAQNKRRWWPAVARRPLVTFQREYNANTMYYFL